MDPSPSSTMGRQELQRIRFGEFLRDQNLIDDEQLIAALGDHWSNGGTIGAAIARHGFLSPIEVEQQARRFHNLNVVEI
jgi:hypothetical protein